MNRFSIIGAAHLDALVEGVDESVLRAGSAPAERIRLGFGGDALNEAVTLARLGGDVELVSKVGNDSAGDMVREFCRAAGLPLTKMIREEKPFHEHEYRIDRPDGREKIHHGPQQQSARACAG